MSKEVKDRLQGNYDDTRRICSTYHNGVPMIKSRSQVKDIVLKSLSP